MKWIKKVHQSCPKTRMHLGFRTTLMKGFDPLDTVYCNRLFVLDCTKNECQQIKLMSTDKSLSSQSSFYVCVSSYLPTCGFYELASLTLPVLRVMLHFLLASNVYHFVYHFNLFLISFFFCFSLQQTSLI